jgi:hypothetical protein
MARKHYWQFLVTDEGNPIENASISIYEAGTIRLKMHPFLYTKREQKTLYGFILTSLVEQVQPHPLK